MQVTGSPQRLLLSIAVCGILGAILWSFPLLSLKFVLLVGQTVPSLALCAFFTYLSKDRKTALLAMALGAFLGWVSAPTVWINGEERTWFDDYVDTWPYWPACMAAGTFIAGAGICVFDFATSRFTSRDRKDR